MGPADLTDCSHKAACGGLEPQLTSDAPALAGALVCVWVRERWRGKRSSPQTMENNSQRAFNGSILMRCK